MWFPGNVYIKQTLRGIEAMSQNTSINSMASIAAFISSVVISSLSNSVNAGIPFNSLGFEYSLYFLFKHYFNFIYYFCRHVV